MRLRKAMAAVLIAVMCIGLLASGVLAAGPNGAPAKVQAFKSKVWVNGAEWKNDVPPVLKSGRILLPMRAIFAQFGLVPDYDAEDNTVTLRLPEGAAKRFTAAGREIRVVVIDLGTGIIYVGSVEHDLKLGMQRLEAGAELHNNRTYVPLRLLAELLGKKVNYNDKTGDVDIDDDEDRCGCDECDCGLETKKCARYCDCDYCDCDECRCDDCSCIDREKCAVDCPEECDCCEDLLCAECGCLYCEDCDCRDCDCDVCEDGGRVCDACGCVDCDECTEDSCDGCECGKCTAEEYEHPGHGYGRLK